MDKMGEVIPSLVRSKFLVPDDASGSGEKTEEIIRVNQIRGSVRSEYLKWFNDHRDGLTKLSWKEWKHDTQAG